MPSDRTIVIERFRDEIGDWRLCVLSPFGGRVHAAWGLALSARIRDQFGLESDAIWSDDGIIVHLPDADEPPGAELVLVEPDELEELVVRELSASALYGARFRENAARALLLPRAYPGKRTPLWQQRLKAQSLLEVAKRYGQFPIVLETYRECLRDVLDLPGLEELLRGLHTRELSLVEVETQRASPFASSLLFDYVATYMYEGDTPNAERRAAALSLDRDLLRELLGQEELRDLIDPAALAEVEDDLQRRSERTRAANADGAARRAARGGRPDHRGGAGARRCRRCRRERMLGDLEKERRAVRMRIGGEERWIAAEDAGLYRDAFGAVPPGGPARRVPGGGPGAAQPHRCAATPAPTARSPPGSRRTRYAIDVRPGAPRAGAGRRPGPGRAAARRLRARVVRPRGAAPAAPRLAGVAAQGGGARRAARARALPARLAGRRRLARPAAPAWTGCARCSCRSRAWRSRPRCGSTTCCRAAWAPTRRPGSTSSAPPASWCGSAPARSGERSGQGGAAVPRRRPLRSARRRSRASARASRSTSCSASGSARGAAFWSDLLVDLVDAPSPADLQEALWDLVWAGEVTNDAFAPLRAPRLSPRPADQREQGRRFARRRRPGAPQVQGRWSLTERLFADAPVPRPADARALRAAARALRHRHPRDRAGRGHPRRLRRRSTASCRTSRRSAPRAAATSSRASAARSSRCRPRSSGCAACAPTSPAGRWCWPPPTRPTRSARPCRGPSARTRPRGARAACRARTW